MIMIGFCSAMPILKEFTGTANGQTEFSSFIPYLKLSKRCTRFTNWVKMCLVLHGLDPLYAGHWQNRLRRSASQK